jgi:hypothetical protein
MALEHHPQGRYWRVPITSQDGNTCPPSRKGQSRPTASCIPQPCWRRQCPHECWMLDWSLHYRYLSKRRRYRDWVQSCSDRSGPSKLLHRCAHYSLHSRRRPRSTGVENYSCGFVVFWRGVSCRAPPLALKNALKYVATCCILNV